MEIHPDATLAEELRHPGADRRWGVSLVARPGPALRSAIQELQARLIAAEPDQYPYPADDLHLTVLELGSELGASEATALAALAAPAIPRALAGLGPIPLSSAVARCDASAAFVRLERAEGLLNLRQTLVDRLEAAGVSARPRYLNAVAHVTIARYLAPLRDAGVWSACFGPLELSEPWTLDRVWLTEGATWYGRRGRLREHGPWRLG